MLSRRSFCKSAFALGASGLWLPKAQVAVFRRKQPAAGGGTSYTYYAAKFTSSPVDYLYTSTVLTGLADGKNGIVSLWFKMTADNGLVRFFNPGGGYFYADWTAGNAIQIEGYSAAGSKVLGLDSSGTYNSGSGWHHLLASWDLAAGTRELYIDGSDAKSGTGTATNTDIDYNRGVGASILQTGNLDGSLCEVYVNLAESIDITSSSNREKFRSSGGKPVDLGSDGSTPTGTAPIVYLKTQVPSFETNSGSGGDFTESGTLEDDASVP